MVFNNSNKSNIILLFQITFLILFICQTNYAQERVWTLVGTDEKETMLSYVDVNAQKQPNGNLFVWEKVVHADTKYAIGLVEWDCRQKRSRTIQQTLYDQYGEPLNMAKTSDWIYVIDGTFGASIYRIVCRNSKNTSKNSPSKTTSKVSLAEITSLAARLRESPNINSYVIRAVSKGEQLILADEEPQGNWYKVIDKETQSEGWLHKTTFKIIKPSKAAPRKKSEKRLQSE
jgi:hypothetical protein